MKAVTIPGKESATLREILQKLEKVYCGKIGVQFAHVEVPSSFLLSSFSLLSLFFLERSREEMAVH